MDVHTSGGGTGGELYGRREKRGAARGRNREKSTQYFAIEKVQIRLATKIEC